MHPEADAWARKHVSVWPGRVLEIGGQDVNCSMRFLAKWADGYVCVDRMAGPGVDVVADFETWAKDNPGERYDTVICLEVLEHAANWAEIIWSAASLLMHGGRFVGTTANHKRKPHSALGAPQPQAGEYYGNVDACELTAALEFSFGAYTVDYERDDLRWAATK